MIYLFLIIIFCLPIFYRHKISFFCSETWYWGECILLILVAGLRLIVGGDTQTYMGDYDRYPTLEEFNIFTFAMFRYQPLWIMLNVLAKSIYQEFYVLQIILACIVNPITFYIIQKETEKKFEVAIVYLLFQFLYFNCEIMRDSLSICIFYFAFGYLIKHKWLPYYGLCILAFLFHDAAIFYFIIPFLLPILTKEFTKKYVLVMTFVILTIANPLTLSKLTFLLPAGRDDSFTDVYSKMEIGSLVGLLRGIIDIVLIYFIIIYTKGHVSYKVYIGTKICFILHILGLFMPIFLTRICNSFNLFYFISWVEFLYVIRKKNVTIIYGSLMLIAFVRTYFVDVTYQVSSKETSDRYYFYERYVPYYSIFETPDNNVIARRKAIYINSMDMENN